MKRLLLIILASSLLIALPSCGGGDAESDTVSNVPDTISDVTAEVTQASGNKESQEAEPAQTEPVQNGPVIKQSDYEKIFIAKGITFTPLSFNGLSYAAYAYADDDEGIVYRYEYGYDADGNIKQMAITKYFDLTDMTEDEKAQFGSEMDMLFLTYYEAGCTGMDFTSGDKYYEMQLRISDLEDEYRISALKDAQVFSQDETFVLQEREAQLLSMGYTKYVGV